MSELKDQIIERSEQILTHPTTQKLASTYAVGTGGAVSFELIQGWLGIASVIVGIVAGAMIALSNYRKTQGIQLDNQIKRVELEVKMRKAIEEKEDEK